MSRSAGWEDRACAGLGTERFFPPKDSPEDGPANRWELAALAVCGRWPVRAVCLEAALEFPATEQHGVLGGMTAGQRRAAVAAPPTATRCRSPPHTNPWTTRTSPWTTRPILWMSHPHPRQAATPGESPPVAQAPPQGWHSYATRTLL